MCNTCLKYTFTRMVGKVSDFAYNRRETRDKRLLGRDPERSRCRVNTSLKLFGHGPWLHGYRPQHTSVLHSVHGSMGCHQESFTGVWRLHQLLSGSLPNGRELFTLSVCCPRCPWSHGLRPKKLHHTRSVALTPAPNS